MKKLTKKQKQKFLVDSLGKGAREVYLEDNPHGFRKIHKVHKSKKAYSRKQKHQASW